MTDKITEGQIKLCCATLYQSDIVHMLLGNVLHPGGLALTYHLGTLIGLKQTDLVLDVACGRGASAIHLAQNFGCHVTGVDYGPENVAAAEADAAAHSVAHLTTFCQGDAERLPFCTNSFDAVISECSFCTFPDKATAAAEIARVLRPGGWLALTDMTVKGALPEDIQSLLSWVICIAGAGTQEEYVATLQAAGFASFHIEDQHAALLEMVKDVRHKLMGVALAAALGKLNLGDILGQLNMGGVDLSEGKSLARRVVELIESGVIGYTLITARRVE